MRLAAIPILLAWPALAQQNSRLPSILARVSEESEVFAKIAPQVVATETLHQRALPTGQRRSPDDAGAEKTASPRMAEREIVSQYGFASLREAPGAIREFRQVISVDGRELAAPALAHQTLAAGLASGDDRQKKKMLETFEKYGLIGTASDFGQVLLLFTKRRLENYAFELSGSARLGAEAVLVVSFRQNSGPEALTIFEKGKTFHQSLQGQCWVRESDLVPLRIALTTVRTGKHQPLTRDEATVDYTPSPHGVVLPAAIVHREFRDGTLVVENIFQYSSFKKFTVASKIEFTEENGAAGPPARIPLP
jgi:hypothetical protein